MYGVSGPDLRSAIHAESHAVSALPTAPRPSVARIGSAGQSGSAPCSRSLAALARRYSRVLSIATGAQHFATRCSRCTLWLYVSLAAASGRSVDVSGKVGG